MKKLVVLITVLFSSLSFLHAQEQTPAALLAHGIADRMKDSLSLSNQQRAKVFAINMELHSQKMDARKRSQYRAVVGKELQKIEGTRDGLYKTVLTQEQYELYIQKKRNLVTAK